MTPTTTLNSQNAAEAVAASQPPFGRSALKLLRALIPARDCDHDESFSIAERQATRLVDLLGQDGSVSVEAIAALPRIRIVYEDLPVSGMSHWNGQSWIISIRRDDPLTRQRFTVLHEFKHIIDHGATARLYRDLPTRRLTPAQDQAEQAADYFAGCVLIPRRALKAAWGCGMQRPAALAEHFGVSQAAIEVRLDQTGLSRERDPEPDPIPVRSARCARPLRTPFWQNQRFLPVYPAYARRRTA